MTSRRIGTSLGFVDVVAEVFVPLVAGVPLVVIDEETARQPERLLARSAPSV